MGFGVVAAHLVVDRYRVVSSMCDKLDVLQFEVEWSGKI